MAVCKLLLAACLAVLCVSIADAAGVQNKDVEVRSQRPPAS